ncbi:hypothetical protein SCA6_003988 [Theobroma cacao]
MSFGETPLPPYSDRLKLDFLSMIYSTVRKARIACVVGNMIKQFNYSNGAGQPTQFLQTLP